MAHKSLLAAAGTALGAYAAYLVYTRFAGASDDADDEEEDRDVTGRDEPVRRPRSRTVGTLPPHVQKVRVEPPTGYYSDDPKLPPLLSSPSGLSYDDEWALINVVSGKLRLKWFAPPVESEMILHRELPGVVEPGRGFAVFPVSGDNEEVKFTITIYK
eukprot:m.414940 g.414940  ORF g.414940 m.414940 type:complete len:158 (+) comp20176_c5_seq4:103-576(+)